MAGWHGSGRGGLGKDFQLQLALIILNVSTIEKSYINKNNTIIYHELSLHVNAFFYVTFRYQKKVIKRT